MVLLPCYIVCYIVLLPCDNFATLQEFIGSIMRKYLQAAEAEDTSTPPSVTLSELYMLEKQMRGGCASLLLLAEAVEYERSSRWILLDRPECKWSSIPGTTCQLQPAVATSSAEYKFTASNREACHLSFEQHAATLSNLL